LAITSEQFKAMQRVAYGDARPHFQTGDILLFSSTGLTSEAIEHFTDSLWSHASILLVLKEIDRVFIMESIDKIGVRMMPVSTRLNGLPDETKPYDGGLLLARHTQFPTGNVDLMNTLSRVALERLGCPYSPMELVKIAERIAAGLVGRVLPGQLSENGRYICSEYVAMCFQSIGISILPDKEGFMAPGDIARDPNVAAVMALTPDPPSQSA
jgi:hypothetical protein